MQTELASVDETRLTALIGAIPDAEANAAMLTKLARTVHGHVDISIYEGFDVILSAPARDDDKPAKLVRHAALLRRRTDGALRLVRHWASAEPIEGDVLVPHGAYSMVREAFSLHSRKHVQLVSRIEDACTGTPMSALDMAINDASVVHETATRLRRASWRCADPETALMLQNMSKDLMETIRKGPRLS